MRHKDSGDGRHVVGDDNQVEGRASRCRAGRVWLGQYATDGGPCQSDAFRTSGTYRPTEHRRPDHVHRWTQSCWIATRCLSEPRQGLCANEWWMSSAVCFEFYPRNTVLTRVLALCLSVTSRCSVKTVEGIGLVFGMAASFHLFYTVLRKLRYPQK